MSTADRGRDHERVTASGSTSAAPSPMHRRLDRRGGDDREGPLDPGRLLAGLLRSSLAAADERWDDPETTAAQTARLSHGTTVGINAIVTRTGARVGLITTKGHGDRCGSSTTPAAPTAAGGADPRLRGQLRPARSSRRGDIARGHRADRRLRRGRRPPRPRGSRPPPSGCSPRASTRSPSPSCGRSSTTSTRSPPARVPRGAPPGPLRHLGSSSRSASASTRAPRPRS